MHPVKVYDKHGKLLRTISTRVLLNRSDKLLKNKPVNHWRVARMQKRMKQKAASQTNNDLFV